MDRIISKDLQLCVDSRCSLEDLPESDLNILNVVSISIDKSWMPINRLTTT